MATPTSPHQSRRVVPVCRCPVLVAPPPSPTLRHHIPSPATPPSTYESDKEELRQIIRAFGVAAILFFCFGAIIFCFWSLIQPSPPEFGVSTGSLPTFNLTGNVIGLTWVLDITSYNPNPTGRIVNYHNLVVSVSYGPDYSLAVAHVKPFSQPGRNWTTVKAQVTAVAQYLNDVVKKMMEEDRTRGVMEFQVDVAADMAFKTKAVGIHTRWEAMMCNRVKFVLREEMLSGVVGSMVETNPATCKYHHQETMLNFMVWFFIFFILLILMVFVFL